MVSLSSLVRDDQKLLSHEFRIMETQVLRSFVLRCRSTSVCIPLSQ